MKRNVYKTQHIRFLKEKKKTYSQDDEVTIYRNLTENQDYNMNIIRKQLRSDIIPTQDRARWDYENCHPNCHIHI